MYITKNKTFSLNTWLNESKQNETIFNALKNKEYNILISFNPSNEAIKYEAINKTTNTATPNYLSIEILPTGLATSPENALYAYIYDIESKLTSESLKEKYKGIYEKIKNNTLSSHENQEDRVTARKEFNILLDELSLTTSQDINEEVDLILSLNTLQDPYTLSLKIKTDKTYVIQSIGEFLSAIREEQYFSYSSNFGFIHSLSTFTPKAQRIISFLSQTYIYHSKKDKEINLYKS